jgi:TldD protein
MKELREAALDRAQALGATYVEVRAVEKQTESIGVKNGEVELLTTGDDAGFGVRVLFGGAWGFACSNRLDIEEAVRVAAIAVDVAKASAAALSKPVKLSPLAPVTARYANKYEVDPFSVPLEQKIELLLAADRVLRENDKIALATGSLFCQRQKSYFSSSDGADIFQDIVETGAGISATAIEGNIVERRSYPNSMGGQSGTRGWELIAELALTDNAGRVRDEAVALLSAPICPSGKTTIIIDGSQLALQVHESIGHPLELDRILGMEASFAGQSFVTLDMLGNFKYGSPIVNVTADATIPGALGSFGYDDEGVPAQRTDLIKGGILMDVLSSRETAVDIGRTSNGTARADGWNRIPLVRMTNINLLPGNWTLDDLIADTDDGLYLETNKSWSIDDKRINFQFATEAAWEIKNGRRGRLYRSPNYTGITPEFWNSCDAICDENHWTVWGTPNCGKGEPMQVAHVAHGASPGRFRNVQVGVGR